MITHILRIGADTVPRQHGSFEDAKEDYRCVAAGLRKYYSREIEATVTTASGPIKYWRLTFLPDGMVAVTEDAKHDTWSEE